MNSKKIPSLYILLTKKFNSFELYLPIIDFIRKSIKIIIHTYIVYNGCKFNITYKKT